MIITTAFCQLPWLFFICVLVGHVMLFTVRSCASPNVYTHSRVRNQKYRSSQALVRFIICTSMAFLKHVKSLPELDSLLDLKGDSLVVIDFWATWCAPCHVIAPDFEQLSNEYRHATFVKVDVDAVPAVSEKYNVKSLPSFKFLKNKEVVHTVVGADRSGLRQGVQTYAGPTATGAGTSSSADGPHKGDASSAGDVSLLEFLETNQLNCLNEVPEHGIKTILSNKGKTTAKSYLQSDTDEQLLLNIYFNQTVRVRSIALTTSTPSNAPKNIKLFINKPSLGFEDVEDAEEPQASQVLELSEDVVKDGNRIPLRFVRFQNVNSLHIFVASNQGDEEETRIDTLDIFGVPVQVTKNLSELRKATEEQ